jgi:uncharacterized protein (DUF983 family)
LAKTCGDQHYFNPLGLLNPPVRRNSALRSAKPAPITLAMHYARGERHVFHPLFWGFQKRCPCCGAKPIYRAYLKPIEECQECSTQLAQIRTDDIAPYFTIMIVGQLIVPALLLSEQHYHPSIWLHFAIWPALTLALMFWFLPRVKGATIAVMWHFGIRGDEQH